VEELLNAGIDVITALNLQHIDSLNDAIEAITGVAPTRQCRTRGGRRRRDRVRRYHPAAVARPHRDVQVLAPDATRRR